MRLYSTKQKFVSTDPQYIWHFSMPIQTVQIKDPIMGRVHPKVTGDERIINISFGGSQIDH